MIQLRFEPDSSRAIFSAARQQGEKKPMQSFHGMEEESGASALLMRLYIGKQN